MKRGQIFLIGFMGAGKSTVSHCFHRRYGMREAEMDSLIEQKEGISISRIFQEKGEEYFRDLETELLRKLSLEENLVVSCGGGTALRRENVDLMKRAGVVVLLTAEPDTIYRRVKDSASRPLLNGNMTLDYIRELLEARRPGYEASADFSVATDGRGAEDICQEILRRVEVELS